MRPVLYLDVDGVLLPLGLGRNGDTDRLRVGPFHVDVYRDIRARLRLVLDVFDVVWSTSWCDDANRDVAPIVGLPLLPVLPVTAHWRKLSLVREHAGEERPIAWIDDRLEREAFAWAEARPGPALLLRPPSDIGLTGADLDAILAFGREHAAGADG